LRVHYHFFQQMAEYKLNEIEFDDEIDFESKAQNILLDEEAVKKQPKQYIELYEAFNKLSKKQREVMELSVVKEWNSSEVAREIGSTPQAVRKLKERAIAKLQNLMGVVNDELL
jgi:RNA polymerase sigma factor (sigma-70 family)